MEMVFTVAECWLIDGIVVVWSVGSGLFNCGNALVVLVFFGARVCGIFHANWAKLLVPLVSAAHIQRTSAC